MKTIGEVKSFYQTELLPDLRVLERQRLAVMQKVLWVGGGLIGLALVLGGWFAAQAGHPVPLFVAVVPAAILSSLICNWIVKGYRSQFKGDIIQKLVTFLHPELVYSAHEGITRETFTRSELFKHRIDRYRSEDQVHGTLGATRVGFSEVHAEYKTRSNKQNHWHTLFRGLFIVADFNKHFRGKTVILPDTAERFLGRLGQKLQSWNISRDQLVKLEDPEFEREFVVYGTDQIEARYILSTRLMERILQFKRKSAKRIHLSFVGSHVFIAVPYQKNLFEPRLFTTLLKFQPVAEYVADLQLGVGIVDDLNLNTRIWTKE
jgi:hypothetical protein